jgi:hypothetical protein
MPNTSFRVLAYATGVAVERADLRYRKCAGSSEEANAVAPLAQDEQQLTGDLAQKIAVAPALIACENSPSLLRQTRQHTWCVLCQCAEALRLCLLAHRRAISA